MCPQCWDFSGIDLKNIAFHDVLMYMDVIDARDGSLPKPGKHYIFEIDSGEVPALWAHSRRLPIQHISS
jgi:hypothetical protein